MTEIRTSATPLEVRDNGNGTVTLSGYASTFNQPYDMGSYQETVAPGAFTRTLSQSPDVRLLVNHTGLPLARTSSGTLRLSQDDTGLRVESDLDATDPDVQALIPKMKRGDLNQMSFAFAINGSDGQSWNKDYSQRTLRSLSLQNGDVSVVTYPANPNAGVALRSEHGDNGSEALVSMVATATRDASPESVDALVTIVLGYLNAVGDTVDEGRDFIAAVTQAPEPDTDTVDPAVPGGSNSADPKAFAGNDPAIPVGDDGMRVSVAELIGRMVRDSEH